MSKGSDILDRVRAHYAAMKPVGVRAKGQAQPEPEKGIIVRVRKGKCSRKCRWKWSVLRDGVLVENGEEETEELARAEAAIVVKGLEEA